MISENHDFCKFNKKMSISTLKKYDPISFSLSLSLSLSLSFCHFFK